MTKFRGPVLAACLAGMSAARLKRIPSVSGYDFTKPGNVWEMANVWVPKEEFVKSVRMQVYGEKRNGEEFAAEALWPELAGGVTAQSLARLVNDWVSRRESLDKIIAQREQALAEAPARKPAEEAAAPGTATPCSPGPRFAPASIRAAASATWGSARRAEFTLIGLSSRLQGGGARA